jgi:hypothetical protein
VSAASFGNPVESPHATREPLRARTSLEANVITSLQIDRAQLEHGLRLDPKHAEQRF